MSFFKKIRNASPVSLRKESPPKQRDEPWYFQLFTNDEYPFYVNSKTGTTTWLLPQHISVDLVKYITHINENGKSYYEEIVTKKTTWELPKQEMSQPARKSCMAVTRMNLKQAEAYMVSKFNEEESSKQEQLLDNHREALSKIEARVNKNNKDKKKELTVNETNKNTMSKMFKPMPEDTKHKHQSSSNEEESSEEESSEEESSEEESSEEESSEEESGDDSGFGGDESEEESSEETEESSDDGEVSEVSESFLREQQGIVNNTATSTGRNASPSMFTSESPNKPVVKQMFEKYGDVNRDVITIKQLAILCYEVLPTYYSVGEIITTTRQYTDPVKNKKFKCKPTDLDYSGYMIWWRNHPKLSVLKLADDVTIKLQKASAMFKK